jgi:hypothetical protein
MIGGKRAPVTDRSTGVIIHDPDAQKAKNLDNPFHDASAQERVAELIARAARRGATSD